MPRVRDPNPEPDSANPVSRPEATADDEGPDRSSYTVVARRYRPQRFEEVVGQDHVVRALRNAIRMNRIAQAYLFCGTRGVGKTTLARIFAKCLNCVRGPTEEPCLACDICQAIAQGQDVDVIEIDGASNNGVEQVRELRQNAGLRPSRSRFKVYYIDEVHMLSTGAFNALLKTLEEPPPHVKFFFATTEANKIPDTVLSRCQRYDLAGITPQLIARTLGEICEREGVQADADALQVVARRASGSLRDAESLLDRLLASGDPRLTVEVVQDLLGTASDDRLLAILEALAAGDSATALHQLDEAALQGVQPADVLGGLLDFLRDAMVVALGAESLLLTATPRQQPRLKQLVTHFPIDSILAAIQVLDQHRSRLRGSLHGRLLVEMAMVRVASMADLQSLDVLLDRLTALESGQPLPARPAGVPAKKKGGAAEIGSKPPPPAADDVPAASPVMPPATAEPAKPAPPDAAPDGAPSKRPRSSRSSAPAEAPAFTLEAVHEAWPAAVAKVPTTHRWRLLSIEPVSIAEPDVLVVSPRRGYNTIDESVCTPDALESIAGELRKLFSRPLSLRFLPADGSKEDARESEGPGSRAGDALASDPLVQKVVELFEARPVQMDYDGTDGGGPA